MAGGASALAIGRRPSELDSRPRRSPIVGSVHVRRALLLFAIVLGLAALTASLSRPGEEDPPAPDGAQQRADHALRVAGSRPSPPEELAFDAAEDDVLELDEGAPRRSR